MSSRPAAHVVKRYPAPVGEHPNKYAEGITVDFRVFWPTLASKQQIELAIYETLSELYDRLDRKRGGAEDGGIYSCEKCGKPTDTDDLCVECLAQG